MRSISGQVLNSPGIAFEFIVTCWIILCRIPDCKIILLLFNAGLSQVALYPEELEYLFLISYRLSCVYLEFLSVSLV